MVHTNQLGQTDWNPERKIIAAAASTLLVWAAQQFFGLEIPPGIEGALAVVVGYFTPNRPRAI